MGIIPYGTKEVISGIATACRQLIAIDDYSRGEPAFAGGNLPGADSDVFNAQLTASLAGFVRRISIKSQNVLMYDALPQQASSIWNRHGELFCVGIVTSGLLLEGQA